MTVHIPFTHVISVKIEDFIAQCDESDLNEVILLAEKKLQILNHVTFPERVETAEEKENYVPMINHSSSITPF